MNRFELYKDYTYEYICKVVEEQPDEYGQLDWGSCIGKDFIVMERMSKDQCVSFILTGTRGKEYIYTCIYTDFNTSNPLKELQEANRSLLIDLEHTQQLLTHAKMNL